ncbi:hypothetical protein Avbf_03739 [Armadillidium vulgare]|nr:hypothetical protein Avbf_03739 [Armadillidium vulgare]
MKEKVKTFSKVRLKCFRDNSDCTNNRIPCSSGKEVTVKNTNENLYKNLLNEVPCTSNEKGTMTDAALKKNGSACTSDTHSISTSPSSYSNIHNVLQSVSKNKADSKEPIVLLSKSPEKNIKKTRSKAVSVENKKINIFEFIASEFENSGESDSEHGKVPSDKISDITSSITQSPEKSDASLSFSDLNESNASQQISPDFKGFSCSKINNANNIEDKLKCSGDKICKKKLFSNVGKDTSIEKGVTTLDHSYSHDTPDKSKLVHPPTDSSLSNNEFPRFVNRSVFGSPTLSKNPPDIMLHNDKINILRQMSQVFNDEKKFSSSINCSQNKTKVNAVNGKLKTSSPLTTKTSALSIATTTASVTTTTATSQLTVSKESYSKSSRPITLPNTSVFEKVAVKSNSNTDKITLEKTDKEKDKIELIKEKTSPVSTSHSGKSLATSSQDDCAEATLSKSNDTSKGEAKDIETATVHLVSSYAFDREESIKVQSYSGSKGEDIDIVDGFTFFSFTTESEMLSYSPSKSRKLKKKKVLTKSQNSTKHSASMVKSKVAVSSSDAKESEILDTEISSENNKNLVKDAHPEGIENQKSETELSENQKDKSEKVSESSAFSSNDLDQYLTEHAELKISFPIPKCSATEKGVTKFDEAGNPIQQSQETSLDTSINNCKSNKQLLESNLVKESVVIHTAEPETSLLKQNSTDLDSNNKIDSNSSSVLPKPCKGSVLKGNDLVVKRGGTLQPLSKVFKKNSSNILKEKGSKSEIIYVPHRGQMLTLCGSLTKVNPSDSGSIKAKVALPRGHRRLFKHSLRVASRKVKAVEINEDLAEFALSALKTPTKDEKPTPVEPSRSGDKKDCKFVKPSKENILDILTAKFSIGKDLKVENNPNSKNSPRSSLCNESNTQAPLSNTHNSENQSKIANGKKSDFPSKIKWNQDDILKKKDSVYTTEESKGFKKNINRFPSLSREMKRLNMNFVTYNKESDEETDSTSELGMKEPCNEEFCKMGCICDSLRCRQKPREHCGKVECMFDCNCNIESWKDGKTTTVPLSVVSILNADHDREKLALKEKDFKRTIVQSGSDLFLLGGEKKKRDIRIPQRFRDTNIWKSPSPTLSYGDSFEGDRSNKENVPILPNSYKEYIKDFKLSIPWYDVNGVSIWCMFHSCYDCTCLSDGSFYCEAEDQTSLSSECEDIVIDKPYRSSPINNFLPQSLTENKIVSLNFKLNNSVNNQNECQYKGHWTLKHWIHNAYVHSSRTCGYDIKERIVKDMNHDLKGYNLPLPKAPFSMGITLKKKIENEGPKKNVNLKANVLPYSKTVFYDGLGPGISFIPTASQVCELYAKFTDNRQLSGIYLKNFEELPPNTAHTSFPKNTSPFYSNVKDVAENLMSNSAICDETSKEDCSTSFISSPTTSTTSTTSTSISGSILQTEYLGVLEKDDPKNDKCFSLYEMIKEEEKRGELELDLSPKEEGQAILITESRFRKLINMNIIGIIGLNKAGRCIINTVKSSEDLIKMQRLQQLISNNTIDVGPNMREIFASSAQVDHRIRYVMIRCDAGGRWEIVGIVQRKNKENPSIAAPKPKRHKIKSPMPAMLLNQAKCRAQSPSTSEHSDSVENPPDSLEGSNSQESHSNLENISSTSHEVINEEIPISKNSVANDLIIEEGETDFNLPCISSVVSGSDPNIGKLIGSPPQVTSSENSDFQKTKAYNLPSFGSYILNQPSSKIFSFDAVSATPSSTSTFPSKNILAGNLRLDSSTLRPKVGNFVLCPRIISSTPSAPSMISSNIGQGAPFSKLVATSVPNDNKIKMLLLPSTTPSGKSFLIPTVNNVPVSYSMIVRGQTNTTSHVTSGKMTSTILSRNSSLSSNSNIRPTKLVPQVQASSKISVIPVSESKIINTNVGKTLVSGHPVYKQNLTSASSFQHNTSGKVNNIHHPDFSNLSTSVNASLPLPPTPISKVGSILSSPVPQVKFLDSAVDVQDVTEKGCKGQNGSPDVKCITIKRRSENCSAVDLSVQFKSIKLHWLSGTIRKSVLLSIFKMSRKINAPVSLSAKNDSAHQSSFLGMHNFCEGDNGQIFPVLVLGNGLKSVLATSQLSFRELFRSNTLKYLINEKSGEISSYTYDAKGVNLIRIASKKKESGVQIHKLGEKIPVENLRETLTAADFLPNVRKAANFASNADNEEIIISDSEDEGDTSKPIDNKAKKCSMETLGISCSRPVAISPSKSQLNVTDTKKDHSYLASNLKRKLESDDKVFPTVSGMFSQKNSSEIYEPSKKLKSEQIFPTAEPVEVEPREKLKSIPVLKIPNPYLKNKPDGISLTNLKTINTENTLSKVEEKSAVEKDVKDSLDHSVKIEIPLVYKMNISPTKVKQTLKLTPKKKPSLFLDTLSPNKLPQHNTENANSDVTKIQNPSPETKQSKFEIGQNFSLRNVGSGNVLNPEIEIPHNSSEINKLKNEGKTPVKERPSSETNASDSSSNLPFSDVLEVEALQLPLKINVADPPKQNVVKRNLDNKPCPLSKKLFQRKEVTYVIYNHRRKESYSNIEYFFFFTAFSIYVIKFLNNFTKQNPNPTDSSVSKSFTKLKTMSVSPSTPKKTSNGSRSLLSSPTNNQEFQQVFSGAPQFWLMDNTEKHNTLERIRRKGLAKMLENLYMKSVNVTSGPMRPPAKHIVLKKAENVIIGAANERCGIG